jgi:L,D-peptidoglycan transpeptidase YkuD (ErfK/YbiS/YcfS/YnhG family)
LHKWRNPRYPTEGCVAFREVDLVRILTNWTLKSRVVIR